MLDTIKIGICEWSLPQYGPYACRLAAELGLDGVQLEMSGHERGYPLSKPVIQKGYLEVKEQTGLEYPSIAMRETDWVKMHTPEGSEDHQIIKTGIVKAVDAAKALGTPMVMIPTFVESEIKTEEDFNSAVGFIQFTCDYAEQNGIMVTLENLLNAEEINRFLRAVDRDNVQLFFDSQNYFLNKGYSTPELLDELMPIIWGLHVKDGKNGALSGALLGRGDTGFYNTIDILKKHNYEGWIILENYYDQEPLSLENEDPIALIREDIEILKNALR